MAFFSSLVSTIFKMIFIAVFAFAGILAGKRLRDNKDTKEAAKKE